MSHMLGTNGFFLTFDSRQKYKKRDREKERKREREKDNMDRRDVVISYVVVIHYKGNILPDNPNFPWTLRPL